VSERTNRFVRNTGQYLETNGDNLTSFEIDGGGLVLIKVELNLCLGIRKKVTSIQQSLAGCTMLV
jgi:hypothetical protein